MDRSSTSHMDFICVNYGIYQLKEGISEPSITVFVKTENFALGFGSIFIIFFFVIRGMILLNMTFSSWRHLYADGLFDSISAFVNE